MKHWFPIIVLAAASVLPVGAQSNELLDELLERDSLPFGDAAYLILLASERLPDTSSPEEAAQLLRQTFPKAKPRDAGEAIPLGEYAYLLMQAFEVKGGLMYRLIPGPRYAARELAYREIIRGPAQPDSRVSGAEAVQILRRLLDWREDRS